MTFNRSTSDGIVKTRVFDTIFDNCLIRPQKPFYSVIKTRALSGQDTECAVTKQVVRAATTWRTVTAIFDTVVGEVSAFFLTSHYTRFHDVIIQTDNWCSSCQWCRSSLSCRWCCSSCCPCCCCCLNNWCCMCCGLLSCGCCGVGFWATNLIGSILTFQVIITNIIP